MFLPRSVRTQAAKPAIKRTLHKSIENDGENASKVQKLHVASGSSDKNDPASKCEMNKGEKGNTSKIPVSENTETRVTLDQIKQPANNSGREETLLSSSESNFEAADYEIKGDIGEREKYKYLNFAGKEDSCVVGCGKWQTNFTENISLDQKTDELVQDDDPVVSYSKNQRWPEEGEPVCIICGRYGEYICDKTEADVCSLECKARNLARMKQDHGGNLMNPAEQEDVDDRPEDVQETAIVSYTYMECLEISRLTREQVQDMRAEVEIFVEGMGVPRPVLSFEQLFLPPKLLHNLKEADYVAPTPVQMQVIPAALKLRDLMVCAPTSSGKTASFVIPSILHTIKFQGTQNLGSGPITLILTPTRELAQQIEDQTKTFMKGIPNMRTALLVGGLPMPPQLHRLKQNIQVVIATPGRLLEILRQGGLSLTAIKLLVIDEVDSMLQFGFQEQVEDIQSQLPESHQTLLFSATIPATIEKLSEQMLKDPIYVSIGTPSTPCSSVKQIILWVEDPSKKKKLFNLLEDPKHYQPPILIFVDSRAGADLLAEAIEKVFGLDVGSLHGDKSQVERSNTLRSFQEGLLPVLVSTGVLGRGLDLPKVKMIINFDMPRSVEEYIHQVGRTGRLGSRGTAISFINNGSKKLFLELVKTLKPLGVPLPPELANSPFLHLQKEQHQSKKHGRTTQINPTRRRTSKRSVKDEDPLDNDPAYSSSRNAFLSQKDEEREGRCQRLHPWTAGMLDLWRFL